MRFAAAKEGDRIVATDTHRVVAPNGAVTPTRLPFSGKLDNELSRNVKIGGKRAATQDSTATNKPRHIVPAPLRFGPEPDNQGTITRGSRTVRINGKPAARHGDPAKTCDDYVGTPMGRVVASGTVNIG